MKKVIAVILGIIWTGFVAVCLFICLVTGPAPDAGLIYLISAAGVSVITPVIIVCGYFYVTYLEDKVQDLEEKHNKEEKKKDAPGAERLM